MTAINLGCVVERVRAHLSSQNAWEGDGKVEMTRPDEIDPQGIRADLARSGASAVPAVLDGDRLRTVRESRNKQAIAELFGTTAQPDRPPAGENHAP